MMSCLITCRSLTYAQRAAAALRQAGITARLIRTPREISAAGCGYSVSVSKPDLRTGVDILRIQRIPYISAYEQCPQGVYREAKL